MAFTVNPTTFGGGIVRECAVAHAKRATHEAITVVDAAPCSGGIARKGAVVHGQRAAIVEIATANEVFG